MLHVLPWVLILLTVLLMSVLYKTTEPDSNSKWDISHKFLGPLQNVWVHDIPEESLSFIPETKIEKQNEEPEEDWIITPHGLRPKECVISHGENNVIVQEVPDGLIAHYPDRKSGPSSMFYKTSQKCIDNANEIRSKLYGGWEIWAHYEHANLSRFEATYTVPDELLPVEDQVLFYFVGLGSRTIHPPDATIIQPVVAWCGKGMNPHCSYSYDYTGWQMAAWNCCPQGLSHYGNSVELKGGEIIMTSTFTNPDTGAIRVMMDTGDNYTSLQVNGDFRFFDAASIAGEFYFYTECNQFNSLPFGFNELNIWDNKGEKLDIPSSAWEITNHNPLNCSGSIAVNYPQEVSIKARA